MLFVHHNGNYTWADKCNWNFAQFWTSVIPWVKHLLNIHYTNFTQNHVWWQSWHINYLLVTTWPLTWSASHTNTVCMEKKSRLMCEVLKLLKVYACLYTCTCIVLRKLDPETWPGYLNFFMLHFCLFADFHSTPIWLFEWLETWLCHERYNYRL